MIETNAPVNAIIIIIIIFKKKDNNENYNSRVRHSMRCLLKMTTLAVVFSVCTVDKVSKTASHFREQLHHDGGDGAAHLVQCSA